MKTLVSIAIIEALIMLGLIWIVYQQQRTINGMVRWIEETDQYFFGTDDDDDDPNAENTIDHEQPSLTKPKHH